MPKGQKYDYAGLLAWLRADPVIMRDLKDFRKLSHADQMDFLAAAAILCVGAEMERERIGAQAEAMVERLLAGGASN